MVYFQQQCGDPYFYASWFLTWQKNLQANKLAGEGEPEEKAG